MTKLTNFAKIACGVPLLILSLVTAAVSMSLNVKHGLEVSVTMAMLFLLAELGRILVPGIAAKIGWNAGLKVIVITCGATSLFAATNAWLGDQITHMVSAQTINAQADRAKGEFARLRGEIEQIDVIGAPDDIKALADGYKAKAEAEAGRGFCGPLCQKAEAQFTATMADLAKARRKAQLEAELSEVKGTLATMKPVVASGFAKGLSIMFGWNEETVELALGLVTTILAIALLEQLVYLGIPGFRLIIAGFSGQEIEVEEVAAPNVIELKSAGREADALHKLIALILSTEDGGLVCSGRELSKRLGVSNSTLASWLTRWCAEGKIVATQINAHKKRFAIAA